LTPAYPFPSPFWRRANAKSPTHPRPARRGGLHDRGCRLRGGANPPTPSVAAPCIPCCPQPTVVTASRAARAGKAEVSPGEGRQSIVEELTATLNETNSVDTYLLAVTALAEMGPRARPAVRAIIRNGERLLVLKDHAAQATPCAERIRCAQQVHQAVI